MMGLRKSGSPAALRAVHTYRALLLLALTACRTAASEVGSVDADTPIARSPSDSKAAGERAAVDTEVDAALDAASDEREAASVPAQTDDDTAASPPLFFRLPDAVAHLPHGAQQLSKLCARGHDDPIADAFCAPDAPPIRSLAELLALIDVDPSDAAGDRSFAITGHSTALGKRSVSAINPRVIFVHQQNSLDPALAVAFVRGELLVEIVTRSRALMEFQFYAVAFKLPCSDTEVGCSPGQLLTSAVERAWQSADLYHEEDLANTELDCRVCHQPDGPGTRKLLRMQELTTPWTHWFDPDTEGGRALFADYYAAHGDETFAGIPSGLFSKARGGLVAALVRIAGFREQPNEFASIAIETEVDQSAPGQPEDNHTPGQSQTWQKLYQTALRGEAISVPYHDVKLTDPTKLAHISQLYSDYRAGRRPLRALPDIRDVLPDDANTLAEMGFALDERLDDRALLTAACTLCHNKRLDQGLSRARFHTDLERLSPSEKQVAIERLNLPPDNPLAMPPRRIHELTETARARLVALLSL